MHSDAMDASPAIVPATDYMWTRRGFLAGAAANLGLAADSDVPSLYQEAAKAGLLYGADSDCSVNKEPRLYAQLMCRHCALYAPILSWRRTEPTPAGPDPAWQDPNIEFARRAGMQLTGGHFIWHDSVPQWFLEITSRAESERAVVRHIERVGSAYAGQVFSWNVVNEPLAWRGGILDGLHPSVFTERFGEAFFEFGFHAARQADPSAILVINDYSLETTSAEHEMRRRALISLIDRLKARGVPIDGIGLQAHLRLDGAPFDQAVYSAFLREIAARGLRILITELDVRDDRRGWSPSERDTAVGDMFAAYLAAALAEPALISVVTWGLSDRYTWLSPTLSPHLGLPDSVEQRPLPFDSNFRPKPAFAAIVSAFRAAPRRSSPIVAQALASRQSAGCPTGAF